MSVDYPVIRNFYLQDEFILGQKMIVNVASKCFPLNVTSVR
jgi:hypothetical protein